MPEIITLQCPSCGARSAFSSDDGEFVCAYCGNRHIFTVPTKAGRVATRVSESLPPAMQPLAPRPREVVLEKRAGGLRLRWRWFSAKYLGLLIFAVIWDAFLCFWYSTAVGLVGKGGGFPWIMVVFPLGHVAVGIGVTYSTVAGLLNTTTLTLDRKNLVVQYDPVPWLGESKTPIDQLAQLFCKEKRSSTKNGVSYTYKLCAVMKDGREMDLVSNLESPQLAKFLEQQIELYLNIQNQPVAGEFN